MPRPERLTVGSVVLLAASIAIEGCHRPSFGIYPYYPPTLEHCLDNNNTGKVADASTDATKETARNNIVYPILTDLRKSSRSYSGAMYVHREAFETASDFILLGLTAATSVAGDVGVKAALGAASTGVAGAHSSVAKNFFDNQSRDAIFTVISANQKVVTDRINTSLAKAYSDYTLPSACNDLDQLYDAGTVLNAYGTIAAAAAPAPAPSPTSPSDSSIGSDIKAKLSASQDLAGAQIVATVTNGDVTLTGSAMTADQRALADGIVKGVSGVKNIDDKLTVPTPPVEAVPAPPGTSNASPPANPPVTPAPVGPDVRIQVTPSVSQAQATTPTSRIRQAIQSH